MINWKYSLIGFFLLLFVSCNNLSKEVESETDIVFDTIEVKNLVRKLENQKSLPHDSILWYVEKVSKISERINYKPGLLQSEYYRAVELMKSNNYKEAQILLEKLINDDNISILFKAKCLKQLGLAYYELNREYEAFELFYESQILFSQMGNKNELAGVYNIIGGLKNELREYEQAKTYLLKSKKINEEINNTKGLMANEINLAFALQMQDSFDLAISVYKSLVPKYIDSNNSLNLSTIYAYMSLNYLSQNKLDSAIYYIKKSIQKISNTNQQTKLASIYGEAGHIYLVKEQYDSASYYFHKSIESAKKYDDFYSQKQALRLLLSIDTLLGNYKNAADKFEELLRLNDSDYMQRMRTSLETAELSLLNEEKSVFIQQQKISLEESRKQKIYWIIISILSIVIILLILLSFFQFRKTTSKNKELLQKKLKLNDAELKSTNAKLELEKLKNENIQNEILIREREQLSYALAIEQKNELLRLIKKDLKNNINEKGALKITDINKILSSIKLQLIDNTEGNLFNEKFSSLHPDFYTRLKNQVPSMTKSEIRFCAFVKLRLDSKQIASILNISPGAIKKMRYRVRKKANLKPDESLDDYILGI